MDLSEVPPPSEEDLGPPRSRFWFYLIAFAMVVAVGWAGVRILLPVVRLAHSNKAAAEANVLVDADQLEQASRKAQDALDLRLFNPEAWRAIARVFTKAGQGQAALGWWRKVAEARPLSTEDRREQATAALLAGDLDFAAAEIQKLRDAGGSPAELLLSARLGEARGDSIQALYFLGRVLTDPTATPADRLGAARVALYSRRRDEPLLRVARTAVEDIALAEGKVEALPALRLLAEYLLSGRGEPLVTATAAPTPRVTKAGLIELIRKHPKAGTPELLTAWDLQLAEATGGLAGKEVIFNEVAARARVNNDLATVHQTADWLLARGELGRAFALATVEMAARSTPLAVIRLEALARLGRWRDVIDLLQSNAVPLEDWYKEMRAAQAYQMVGESVASQQRWGKAIRFAALDQRKLLEIARFAAGIGATRASSEAARAVLKLSPDHRIAHELMMAAAERMGGTEAVLEHLRMVRGHWPDDPELEVRELYLSCLRGEDPRPVTDRAATLLRLRPESPDRRAAYALALYRAGRFAEAMTTVTERAFLREAENAALLVIRTAVLRANGFGLEADKLAQQIPKSALRSEEVALLGRET